MRAEPVRARVLPHVRRLHPHGEAVLGERVLDPEIERERVAGSRVQPVLERGAIGLVLDDRPLRPAHEPVDRVPPLGLVERELVALARRTRSCRPGPGSATARAAARGRSRTSRRRCSRRAPTRRRPSTCAGRRRTRRRPRCWSPTESSTCSPDGLIGSCMRRKVRRQGTRRASSPSDDVSRRSRFLALTSHEPARVDGRRSRPDPVRDDLALPLPVRAAHARPGAARRDHADALVPVGRRGVAAADALLRDAAPDQLRDRGRDRARPGVRVRDELVGLLEVRRQRLRRAAGDRGSRGVHARVDLPRPLDLRLEPALAARPSGDDLDRRRSAAGSRATSSSSPTRGCSTRSATRSWTARRS